MINSDEIEASGNLKHQTVGFKNSNRDILFFKSCIGDIFNQNSESYEAFLDIIQEKFAIYRDCDVFKAIKQHFLSILTLRKFVTKSKKVLKQSKDRKCFILLQQRWF